MHLLYISRKILFPSLSFDGEATVKCKSIDFVGKPDRLTSGLMMCLPFLPPATWADED